MLPKKTKRQQADQWIDENPLIYASFREHALALANAGEIFGINLIREVVRYKTKLSHSSKYAHKIPNQFSPYIARRLIYENPILKDYMTCHVTKDELDGVIRYKDHPL